jgi:hypothetical protein
MPEIAKLEINVDTHGIEEAVNKLALMVKASTETESTTKQLTSAFKRAIGPILGVGTALAGLRKLIEVNREFDKLNAGLITSTGSAKEAGKAFKALEEFAANTPYSLRDVTDAFTKLVNYGLTPSERALRSYGDTSSALGKDLTQMIEAVADAQTGEFERLKEFGIKARQNGNNVEFTFRGVTTTVKKSASDIESYLIKLGENNFAGAMAERMKTLDGALSNLGDAWDTLFRAIGKSSVGEALQDSVRAGIDAIGWLTQALQSDTLRSAIDAFQGAFIEIFSIVDKAVAIGSGNFGHLAEIDRIKKSIYADMALAAAGAANERAWDEAMTEEARGKDRLAGYGVGGGGSFGSTAKSNKGYTPTIERGQDSDFYAAWQEREKELQALLDKETELSKQEIKRQATAKKLAQEEAKQRQEVLVLYNTEEDNLRASEDRKQKIIEDSLAKQLITKDEYTALMIKRADEQRTRELNSYASTANAGEQAFATLAGAAKNSLGEESQITRSMFAMSKAFAIASGTIAIAQGSANALKLSWPANLAAWASVAATGAQLMSTIMATNYTVAYDKGGNIPTGGFGLVGERGPEFVSGPATVIGREETAQMLGGNAPTVIVAPDMNTAAQFMRSRAGDRAYVALARRNATAIRRITG